MITEYFERIGYAGAGLADLPTLRAVHALHVAAIPFENFSPFLGEAVPLDTASLEAKMDQETQRWLLLRTERTF